MNIVQLLEYVRDKEKVTIPEIRRKFGVGYNEARDFIAELEKKNLVKIEGGGFVYRGMGDDFEDEDFEDEEDVEDEDFEDEDFEDEEDVEDEDFEDEEDSEDDNKDDSVSDESFEEHRKRLLERIIKRFSEDKEKQGNEDDSEADESSATTLEAQIEKAKRALSDSKKRTQQTAEEEDENVYADENSGESDDELMDEVDGEAATYSELEKAVDAQRDPLICELDGLFDKGEKTGESVLGGALQDKKVELIDRIMRIEGEAVAEGSEGGRSMAEGFRHFICAVIDEISVEQHEYYDDIKADMSYPDGTRYDISLMFDHFLTDNGKTIDFLAERMNAADDKVVAEIRRTAANYSVELVGGQLMARVPCDPYTALISFMRFVVAIDAVANIMI